ncbi:MAG TPA: type II secretion system F family protein [Methylomirabilota bacterium]|nr:type II secretion system F family protein [Methylomirabilota bacterium]
MEVLLAALTFVIVVGSVLGLWWASASRRAVRERLTAAAKSGDPGVTILHESPEDAARRWGRLGRSSLYARLTTLAEQSGRTGPVSDVLLIMATFAAAGAVAGWIRTGVPGWSLLCALVGAAIPVLFLVYKRQQRLKRFSKHFPDALDMMARSIRAGYALAGGIQLVGEEMPDPVGEELRRVFEEIRLGLEPGDALSKLVERVPTDDVKFFCTAIRIQRTAGGNLAETLDRLSEVIRERFKLLNHAHAIAAQQRWGAIFVGSSPLGLAILLRLMNASYFDEAITHPAGPTMLLVGLAFELIGFVMIWRIAKIKV